MRILFSMFLATSLGFAAAGNVSVNGGPDGSPVEQGLPVMLSVTSTGSARQPAPERLEATGPDGVRATLIHRPAASEEIALGSKVTTRTDVWTLSPDETASLPPGKYTVRLADTQQATFTLTAGTTSDSADARAARLLLVSAFAELAGDSAKALEAARQIVADQPTSVAGKLRLSDLLAEQGQFAEALRLLDEAEMQVTGGKRLPHPPVMIRARQAELLERITQR